MRRITKSVISLSEIPEELHNHEILIGHKEHTYIICHLDNDAEDDLSLWLLEKYPTLKRRVSFLIHIDKQ
jgi:hypothetical protein